VCICENPPCDVACECSADTDCSDTEYCDGCNCNAITCPSGYIPHDHSCVAETPPPPLPPGCECSDNNDCADNEVCNGCECEVQPVMFQ